MVTGPRAFIQTVSTLKPLQKGPPKGPAFISGPECFSECREECEEFKVRKNVGINPNPAPCSTCVPGSAEGLEYESPWPKFSPPPAFLLFNSCLWLFSPYKGKAECFRQRARACKTQSISYIYRNVCCPLVRIFHSLGLSFLICKMGNDTYIKGVML